MVNESSFHQLSWPKVSISKSSDISNVTTCVQVKQRKETSGKVLLNAYFKKNRAAFFFNNEQDKIGYIGTKESSTIPIFWWNPHFNDFLFCLFGLVWFENTVTPELNWSKHIQTCPNLSKFWQISDSLCLNGPRQMVYLYPGPVPHPSQAKPYI